MYGTTIKDIDSVKECPFCGCKKRNSPMVIKEKDYDSPQMDKDGWGYTSFYHVTCLKCKCKTGEYKSIEKAVEAWNKRTTT